MGLGPRHLPFAQSHGCELRDYAIQWYVAAVITSFLYLTNRLTGMGNRFRDMPHYHTLIVAHGVIATIVFLGLVPLSILLVRYYSLRNPYQAFRYHVWCQVLTLFLSTVVFVLGWFAVGPNRSLTNPHHGIGLAIYVIVIFQVFWGWLVHKIERNKKRFHVPLKLVVSNSAMLVMPALTVL
jgi:hypothetical protein